MTVDVFLKLADIKGDSNDAKHKDEIRVLSWDWGMEHSEASLGGSAGVGKTQFRRIRFAHLIDVASPLIMLAGASGRHIREASLTVRRAGAAPIEFLMIKLDNLVVSSVETAVNEEKGDLFESVTLDFEKIDFQYIPQTPQGTPGPSVRFGWDVRRNAPF